MFESSEITFHFERGGSQGVSSNALGGIRNLAQLFLREMPETTAFGELDRAVLEAFVDPENRKLFFSKKEPSGFSTFGDIIFRDAVSQTLTIEASPVGCVSLAFLILLDSSMGVSGTVTVESCSIPWSVFDQAVRLAEIVNPSLDRPSWVPEPIPLDNMAISRPDVMDFRA
jgi:hypothetical protein